MTQRPARLRPSSWRALLLVGAVLSISRCALAGTLPADSTNADFFETRVRPILAEHCYKCHSSRAEKLKGGLRLDDRNAFLKGGESGPEIVPGHPENSRLIEAIGYQNPDLQMPPKTRLSAEQAADLSRWVASGAVWPLAHGEPEPAAVAQHRDIQAPAFAAAFDLRARRAAHWAWQPIRRAQPPAVVHGDWPRGTIDNFILARLEQQSIPPAPDCDRRTLIRRASFILTGLPPTPQDVEAFVVDDAPDAFAKVVDRLLASPRFGEHWARHWMDLVRYSDTLGNEAGADIPNAWQYRDYVIRAFNADTPYDQFVTEHIAGDLLDHPRRDPETRSNQSIIGTGFFWMNEGKRSPVDVRQAEADCFDNKIDVLCKTFLGLTVACARCHDHKFDAITQRDYYALYGYLKSSRYTQALLNRTELDAHADELSEVRVRLRSAAAAALAERAGSLSRYLVASEAEPSVADDSLSSQRVAHWKNALHLVSDVGHPMYPWVKMASLGAGASQGHPATQWHEIGVQVKQREAEAIAARQSEGDIELAKFGDAAKGFGGWFAEDQAFGPAPCQPGDFLAGDSPQRPIQTLFRDGAWAHSGYLSRRLQGTLRSPTVTLDHRYLHVLAAGRQARVNVNIEHFVMIQAPLYESLRWVVNDDGPQWHTFDLGMWQGCSAYIEFADTTTPDLHDKSPAGIGVEGYVAVSRAVLSDRQEPPSRVSQPGGSIVTGIPQIDSLQPLADAYQRVAVESLQALGTGELSARPDAEARASFLSWLIENGLLDPLPTAKEDTQQLETIFNGRRDADSRRPEPERAPATIDGTAEDEHVFIRGNHANPGPLAPRRLLEAIAGDSQPPAPETGSGRLDLARRLLGPSDPFVPRVMVNRVWYHVFGRGIVLTVDNFGALGEPPTHPELLDYLSCRFIDEKWSVKKLIREMVLSRTFAMSSTARGEAESIDPDNRLFHRMPVRRLEAESIRDEVLKVSGRLDERMYGPGVEVFLTPEMQAYAESYGKPARGGPLDGDGRRSIYLAVRRNFLTPMLLAFDAPQPLSTVGRRTVSNVPAQALTMMNDPFVTEQAAVWARRVLAMPDINNAEARIRRMYVEAFARPPSAAELADVLTFLDEHGQELGVPADRRSSDPRLWADVAHVLMNLKEFIFIN
jgi:mono/diheme cytochrome c family protein